MAATSPGMALPAEWAAALQSSQAPPTRSWISRQPETAPLHQHPGWQVGAGLQPQVAAPWVCHACPAPGTS